MVKSHSVQLMFVIGRKIDIVGLLIAFGLFHLGFMKIEVYNMIEVNSTEDFLNRLVVAANNEADAFLSK